MRQAKSGTLVGSRGGWCVVALLAGVLVPRAAAAVQSAELYRTEAYFYGRFEARIRFAPGEGVVSSFFLWKDGSSSTTSWNELDYEKTNSTCKLQTNIWTGTGTQSSQSNTPTFNICNDYHTYAIEWTPDYISWLIDGSEIRKVTGASVDEYTKNASQGMSMHFNTWEGNSSFGGTLNPSTLPVQEFISWTQYSSYSNGSFQLQWREEFDGSSLPDNWGTGTWASVYNLSTHNPDNVTFSNGIAVLSMTADNATGFSGTPPVDSQASSSGSGGATGSGGTNGSGSGGATGSGGSSASGGASSSGGSSPSGGTTGTGGSSASGGASSSGGSSASGGSSSSGGASASGGKTGSGSGGASSTGGALSSGGVTGSGGVSSTGGSTSSSSGGNSSSGASGGVSGGSASGGSSGCRIAGGGPLSRGGAIAALLIGVSVLRRRRSPGARKATATTDGERG